MHRAAGDISGEAKEQGRTKLPRSNNNVPNLRNRLLRLRTFACYGLPAQDMMNGNLPYVLGFQKTADGDDYLAYKSQELSDDVDAPRWNPDMMFHLHTLADKEFELHVKDVNIIFADSLYGIIKFNIADLVDACFASTDGTTDSNGHFGDASQYGYSASFSVEDWLSIYPIQPSQDQLVDLPGKFYDGIFGYLQKQIKITTIPKINPPHFPKGKAATYKDVYDPDGLPYIEILEEDEQVPIPAWAGPLIQFLNTFHFDKKEENRFGGRAQGKVALQNLVRGGLLPAPMEGQWEGDLTDDANTARFFFINQGANFMRKNPITNEYEVDFGFMDAQNFEMIEGHHPYCGKMIFDPQTRLPIRIIVKGEVYVPPAQGGDLRRWEWAKFLLRSSCFVINSVLHLTQIHQVWANYPNIAMREHFDPNHPVRLLMSPFYYRSAMVARKSINSLVPNQGLLHRGLAYNDINEWQRALKVGFSVWKFQTFQDEIKEKNLLDDDLFPVGIDGIKLENTIYKFVSNYLDVFYNDTNKKVVNDKDLFDFWERMQDLFRRHLTDPVNQGLPREFTLDNLKIVLAECIFRVTGGHSQAGDAIASALDPCMVNLRISQFTDDDDRNFVAPFEASAIQCAVTALTALPIAKLDTDVSHFFVANKKSLEVYRTFLDDLAHLSTEIKKANQMRQWPLSDFDPNYCNISTAV